MFGLKPMELILLLAVSYLFYDKFKKPTTMASKNGVAPLNGASGNTAPSIIDNGSGVGDNFDLQVEYLTNQLGY